MCFTTKAENVERQWNKERRHYVKRGVGRAELFIAVYV